MREIQNKNKLEKATEVEETLSLSEASTFLGVEDYWVEELLLIGDLKSLRLEDLEHYMMDAPTQEMDNKHDRKNTSIRNG
tara:strand:+ start:521 stop:760 length:240 start_codon:yes stop_codon:yes gene_type:complete